MPWTSPSKGVAPPCESPSIPPVQCENASHTGYRVPSSLVLLHLVPLRSQHGCVMNATSNPWHPLTEADWNSLRSAEGWRALETSPEKLEVAQRRAEFENARQADLIRRHEYDDWLAQVLMLPACICAALLVLLIKPPHSELWISGIAFCAACHLLTQRWFWLIVSALATITMMVTAMACIIHFMIFYAVLNVIGAFLAGGLFAAVLQYQKP